MNNQPTLHADSPERPTMRPLWLAVCGALCVAALACGSPVIGSCRIPTNTTHCQEYDVHPLGRTGARALCQFTTWSESPCPSAGRVGRCQYEVQLDAGVAVYAQSVYAPATTADAQAECDNLASRGFKTTFTPN